MHRGRNRAAECVAGTVAASWQEGAGHLQRGRGSCGLAESLVLRRAPQALARANPAAFQEEAAEAAEAAYRALADRCGARTVSWPSALFEIPVIMPAGLLGQPA